MPSFGKSSQDKLSTCHQDLQRLFSAVVEKYDCTIVCGHRAEAEQNAAVKAGQSKLSWPNSKHTSSPSLAVDVVPYPIDWTELERFYHFAGFVYAMAAQLNIKVRWGGDWDGDLRFREEKFKDLPHWELIHE